MTSWPRASPLSRLRASSAVLLALLATPRGAHASARFEVAGTAQSPDGTSLEVTVALQNKGDLLASPLTIQGELVAERREARLDEGVAPGATGRVVLHFPLEVPRPGLHALTLLLEWPVGPLPAQGTLAPMASQRAFLLLTLGALAEPAVRVVAPDLELETSGTLAVGLESADGAAHRVSVRVLTPHGLNVLEAGGEVIVPATGRATSPITLLRGSAPRESQQGIVVVASVLDGPLERTAVATGVVKLARDPALLPRLRTALWFVAAGLLAAAAYAELKGRFAPAA